MAQTEGRFTRPVFTYASSIDSQDRRCHIGGWQHFDAKGRDADRPKQRRQKEKKEKRLEKTRHRDDERCASDQRAGQKIASQRCDGVKYADKKWDGTAFGALSTSLPYCAFVISVHSGRLSAQALASFAVSGDLSPTYFEARCADRLALRRPIGTLQFRLSSEPDRRALLVDEPSD